MVFQHHAQGWVYAAFSNHGGENEVIKIGFTSNIETRYSSGTREIFYHEPDQRIADVGGYPAGALEQQILGFMEKLDLRISKQDSYSGSTETVRIDPGSVIIIQGAIPSGNRAVDRFIAKVLNYLGPTGDPGVRPNSTPGKIIARQAVSRRHEDSRDNEVAVDWSLSDLINDDEVAHRPASRGARSFVGLNPEDWRGLSRVKRA